MFPFLYSPLLTVLCNLYMCFILTKALKFWLLFPFLSSFFSLCDTLECRPLTQPGRPPPLSLSHHFFPPMLFLQKSHHFGVSAVRSHSSHAGFCFNSVFMLSSLLLFSSLLLHFVPIQTQRAALTPPANGHGQRVREFVCQKIVCGG